MPTIPITINKDVPIEPYEVTVNANRPAEFTDRAALRMCVRDAERATAWLDQQQWKLMWRESDILYQAPRNYAAWDANGGARANVSRFTVAKHVNSLVPPIISGIFYDSPPFILRPRPGTDQKTTRAKTALFAAVLPEDFKTECEAGIDSQCLNGTGIWTYGWQVKREVRKQFIRKKAAPKITSPFGTRSVPTEESDEIEVQEIEVKTSRPYFEHVPLGEVMVDPGWRHPNQIWKAKYVVRRQYPTMNDLRELRNQDGYDIPSDEALKMLFFPAKETALPPSTTETAISAQGVVHHAEQRDIDTTEDPTEQPLKMDTRVDKYKVIVVLQDKLIIRNEMHGNTVAGEPRMPFLSANWWNIQRAGYGLGVGRLVGSDQRVDAGTMNALLDILAYVANPQWARLNDSNAPTQHIRQRLGGIIDVSSPSGDVSKALKIMDVPEVSPGFWQVLAASKQASESTSGADEAMAQGSIPGRGSSIVRTATGAGGVMAAQANRIEGPVGRFIDNVLVPFLYALDDMISERMPLQEIRDILADELGEAEDTDMDRFFSARYKFEALAGAHLAAKKAMAQLLPLYVQIFENPRFLESMHQIGWTVDIKELLEDFYEVGEWRNARNVIRKLSPQEKQMYMMHAQAPAQAQLENLKSQNRVKEIAAKHAVKSQEIDQQHEAKMATQLTEGALDRAEAYEERRELENAESPQAVTAPEAGQFYAGQ